jgi:hypothetical protein
MSLQETDMRARLKNTVLVALVAMSAMAAGCFKVTDPFVVSVNVKDIKNTYNVTPGTINFAPGCITKNSSDYLDANFDVTGAGRLVDVIVKTNGTFAGNIVGGQVLVGASSASLIPLTTYSGQWNAFNTPQSLLQHNVAMNLNAGGVTTLQNLIQNQQSIVICHSGSFSPAAGTGMSIDVTLFAQVDATP